MNSCPSRSTKGWASLSGVLAGGLLSGKYRRGHKPPGGTRQLANWGEPPVYDQGKLYDIVEVLITMPERGVASRLRRWRLPGWSAGQA